MKNTKEVHMRQHLFFHYGWFLQNLEKGCIRTNMHTTVFIIQILIFKQNFMVFLPLFYATFQCGHYNTKNKKRCPLKHKKMPSKLTCFSLGWAVFSTANWPKTSPNLKFCFIYMSHRTTLKSVNLQYNTLVRWADGTYNSSTKCLMFQVLLFFS